jgi:hypothetical protein
MTIYALVCPHPKLTSSVLSVYKDSIHNREHSPEQGTAVQRSQASAAQLLLVQMASCSVGMSLCV